MIFASCFGANAQSKYQVLPWHSKTTLYKYLMQQVNKQYNQRLDRLSLALRSSQSMLAYRRSRRKRYLKLLGNLPKKTPVHAKITRVIHRNGYIIRKVIYQSFPHHHVTANLYVPDGKGPYPGILFLCGHEMSAKATKSYQKTAILFAKHGFVMLVIDPIGQGERLQLTNEKGDGLTRGATTSHTLLDAGALLVGTSVAAYELWDNEQGLNFLCSLPKVDTTRLGVIGNSGGAGQTTYFMAYEPKIKAAAECSFVTQRKLNYRTIGPQDGCQWLPYEGRARLTEGDFLIMHAPKPILMLAGKYDFFSFIGTRKAYNVLQQVYSRLGSKAKLKLFAYPTGHGIQKPKREATVMWFRRWFYGDSAHITESNLQILPEKKLQCTKTGQVNTSYPDELDVQQHNVFIADTLKKSRQQFKRNSTRAEYLAKIRQTIGLPSHETAIVKAQFRGKIQEKNYTLHKVILRRKGQPPMPCLIMLPKRGKKAKKTIIWFSAKGKAHIADSASLMHKYWKNNDAVILADMRGMGETEDPARFNASKYHNREYRDEAIALHIGRPLVGQRVEDVQTVMDYIKKHERLDNQPVVIYANGAAATPALYAAVFNHKISKLYLYHTIKSYEYIVRHPLMKNAFSYVVPNVLKYYDLPNLVHLVDSLKVVYNNPM